MTTYYEKLSKSKQNDNASTHSQIHLCMCAVIRMKNEKLTTHLDKIVSDGPYIRQKKNATLNNNLQMASQVAQIIFSKQSKEF